MIYGLIYVLSVHMLYPFANYIQENRNITWIGRGGDGQTHQPQFLI